MRIHLNVLDDNSVSLMTDTGQILCNFHTMDHAISFCREWQTSDQEMLYPHDSMDVNSSSCSI